MGTAARGGNTLFAVLGTARLPRIIGGVQPPNLMVELVIERRTNQIMDVHTSMNLGGYITVLREALVGEPVQQVDRAVQRFEQLYVGALARPTVAAIRNAVAVLQDNHR